MASCAPVGNRRSLQKMRAPTLRRPAPRCSKALPIPLFFHHVPAPIPHFVAFEVLSIDVFCRVGFFALRRPRTLVTAFGMEFVIDMAPEISRAMEPRTDADKHAPGKPFRPIVAV